jgi:DNA-directed RNA polymerase subunit RPC12/RpoP
MPILFTCPHCGLQTNVADEHIGHSGPCARCGRTITVGRHDSPLMGTPTGPPMPQRAAAPAWAGTACPNCGGRSQRAGPWPWYLGTIGAMLVRAVVCNHCGHEFDARKPTADLAKRKLRLALLLNGLGGLGILLVIGALVALILSLE